MGASDRPFRNRTVGGHRLGEVSEEQRVDRQRPGPDVAVESLDSSLLICGM